MCVYIFVQSLSYIRLSVTPWTVACQASLSFTISQVCSNSCPLSQWCQATISSSVAPSPPALNLPQHQGHFQRVSFFSAGGQRIRASASAPVLSTHIQGWSPLGLTGLMSLQSKRLSRIFSSTTVQKHEFFSAQLSFWSKWHPYMTTGKTITLTTWTFVGNMVSLLFNTMSIFLIKFFQGERVF